MLMLMSLTISAQYVVTSPDGNIKAQLTVKRGRQFRSLFLVPERLVINVTFGREKVVSNREIGLTIKSKGRRYNFGRMEIVKSEAGNNIYEKTRDYPIALDDFSPKYNNIVLQTNEGITLELRAYDEGVAYRFTIDGFDGEYKILRVSAPFPDDKPIADFGTFVGKYSMPWVSLVKKKGVDKKGHQNTTTYNYQGYLDQFSEHFYQSGEVIRWRDALSSVSFGITANTYKGGGWKGNVGMDWGFYADAIYKYFYAGLQYTPKYSLLYSYMEKDKRIEPFDNVEGYIYGWSLGGKLGFSIPIQLGLEIWSITPYAGFSYMGLIKDEKILRNQGVNLKEPHLPMVGPGIKIQCALSENIVFGMNYEYQFFTKYKPSHSLCPRGRSTFTFSIGRQF